MDIGDEGVVYFHKRGSSSGLRGCISTEKERMLREGYTFEMNKDDSLVLFFSPVPANFCIFFRCDVFFFGAASKIGGMSSHRDSREGMRDSQPAPGTVGEGAEGEKSMLGLGSGRAVDDDGSHGIDQLGRRYGAKSLGVMVVRLSWNVLGAAEATWRAAMLLWTCGRLGGSSTTSPRGGFSFSSDKTPTVAVYVT